jgi:hypothetical protein
MGKSGSSRFGALCVAAVLGSSGLLAACSAAPDDTAPIYALPIYQAAPAAAGSGLETPGQQAGGAGQLRYLTVPAHKILKRAKLTLDHPRHAKLKAGTTKTAGPAAAAKEISAALAPLE